MVTAIEPALRKWHVLGAAFLVGAGLVWLVGSRSAQQLPPRERVPAADSGRLGAPAAVATSELTARDQRLLHGAAPTLGPREAALTFVEFADFQSEDCARAAPMAHMLSEMFADRARFVFREYPSSKHPDAHLAAEASLAAHAQGKFWPYHDRLFANPHDLQRPALERYASEVGLDMSAFRHALDARQFAADVDADIALGHRVHASQFPSLYLNGELVSVPYGVAELTRLVESRRGRSDVIKN